MKVNLKLDGMDRVRKRLKKMSKAATSPVVDVGHTANYSVHVHETHPTKSKFLEQSLRRARPQVKTLVGSFLQRGASFGQALFMVGLNVQRGSQKACPVDTGHLKGSAYTRLKISGSKKDQQGPDKGPGRIPRPR